MPQSMASEGLEGPSKSRGNQGVSDVVGAQIGAVDADWIEIVELWRVLRPSDRAVLSALGQALHKTALHKT